MVRLLLAIAGMVLGLAAGAVAQAPVGNAITYQGELRDGSSPAAGLYDLRFRLYNVPSGGVPIGQTVCLDNIAVTDGRFTAELDFGNVFPNQERFVEIEVRRDTGISCALPGGFVLLAPRQKLTPTPQSLFARDAADSALLGGQDTLFYRNASNLSSGTINDARLSSGIPRLYTSNSFTGASNTFSGQVGVRTTSPLGGLHVRQEPVTFGGTLTLEGSTHSFMSFFPQGTAAGRKAYMGFASANTSAFTLSNESSSLGQIILVPGASSSVTVGLGPNNLAFIFDVRGNANIAQNLQVQGWICASGSIGGCSDARYKEDVEPLEGALALVEALRPVEFEWRREDFADLGFTEGRQIGFIAQEVQRVLPGLVGERHDGYLMMDYSRLTPVLTQAIREQQREIEALRAHNAGLEARLLAIETLLRSR
jgi:hypothetical protein